MRRILPGLSFVVRPKCFVFRDALNASSDAGAISDDLVLPLIVSQCVFAIALTQLINTIPALGEEIGWRSMLYPSLSEAFGSRKAVLIAGVVWGLWHAPITVMGHNYGLGYAGFPFAGILSMCVFCTTAGTCFAWLRERAQSVWPCALAHGAINAISGIGVYFCLGGQTLLGPSPAGLVGGIPLLVLAVLCFRSLPGKTRS